MDRVAHDARVRIRMECKHCHTEIELSGKSYSGPFPPWYPKWRHTNDQMFACFDDNGPMHDGTEYFQAEPE
jgi:hypothetical protein